MVGRPRVVTTAEDSSELEALALSARRDEADRARAILLSASGWTSGQIARAFGVTPDSVRRWRMWFMAEGVDGCAPTRRPERPRSRARRRWLWHERSCRL